MDLSGLFNKDSGLSPFHTAFKGALESYQDLIKAQFAGPNAKEALVKAQQENQWNPKIWQSEIGLRGAQTGLANEQAKWYGPNAQSEINLRGSQSEEQKALAQSHNLETALKQFQLDQYKKLQEQEQKGGSGGGSMAGYPGAGGANAIPGNEGTAAEPAYQPKGPYGIPIPKPNSEDLMNKNLFNTDTFSKKQEMANEQYKQQYDLLNKKATASNEKVQANTDFMNQFNQYDALMDETLATGGLGGYIPSAFSSGQQEIKNIVAKMSLPAVSSMRAAMGNSKFAIPEFTAALATKPNEYWNKQTRQIFREGMETGAARDNQLAQIDNFVKNNPGLGIDSQTADTIKSVYQKHYPIISKDGKSFLKKNTIGQNWRPFFTPQAIQSILDNGDYNPKKNAAIPKFNTKSEALDWYAKQDEDTKAAVKARLGIK